MQNNLMSVNAAVTMSSREISDLIGSRIDNVKTTIERLANKGVISKPALQDGKKSGNGVVEQLYLVTKRDSFVVVAQLCPEFTAALVDRWQELEAQAAQPKPVTHLDTARMLVASLEIQAVQAEQLAIAAPKAAFVDQYVEAAGSMSFRQVAKLIGASERQFRQMLIDKEVIYYLGGVLTPYKPHQDAGRFEVKTGTSEHNGHAFSQARFTAKGVEWIAGKWAAHLIGLEA